ncbi:unnamed protein product [Brassicogethes aeneus]|uniref:AAA+ ATPase domain-containing protein n=1 Tax=Brassicogethes aeneus TaxID=1431903 RepID=A0A9P0BH60_BRAAE|nr:unnamed protein product [Brassicogethes aeneus]
MDFTQSIEIVLKSEKTGLKTTIIPVVQKFLEKGNYSANSLISKFNRDEFSVLHDEVQHIVIGDIKNKDENNIDFINKVKYYVYTLDTYGELEQYSDDNELLYGSQYILPSAELFDIWENLYYESNIKENLLKYAHTMMEFSDKGVNYNIVTCNRVILLHGPPGTGKTSLSKALAQKLSIIMQDRYPQGIFIEIKTDCLFSKYFSESVKLVTRMFRKIHEVIENSNMLVCVLIDEVESLVHARDLCTDSDPSDSIKVVNAVLTQIDQLKKHPNVLIFCTSNMTNTIDVAFVDRADIKQYLGLPSMNATYKIYHSCLEELIKAQVIFCDKNIEDVQNINKNECMDEVSKKLLEICKKSEGLSARCLRKIPFIAHALFVCSKFVQINDFLDAMEKAIDREHAERSYFCKS